MSKIPEYPELLVLTADSYVLGVEGDSVRRFKASTFRGADGADGVDGYTITDNTGASSELLLAAGSVAYIDYTTATSVPLNIQTEEGLYEMDILGNQDVTIGAAGSVNLNPNNTTVTAGAIDYSDMYISYASTDAAGAATVSGYKDGTGQTAFGINYNLCVKVKAWISTITKSKTLCCDVIRRDSATAFLTQNKKLNWLDTTTAWTSLGTITFPFAQSGKIVIRRII